MKITVGFQASKFMEIEEIEIRVYDKRCKITSTMYVEELTENTFRMTDNDIVKYFYLNN